MIKITKFFPYPVKITLISIALVSCAKISTVSTNFDQKNFSHYFSPSQVKIIEQESDFTTPYKMIGGVEGESCQAKVHSDVPNKIDARTMARRKAFELGANAIIFSGCTTINTQRCHSNIVCYGKAYQVENQNE